MLATEPVKAKRVELILRQVESLPTLPAVAMRVLALTSSDDSHASQIVELIKADPSLTAKILSLCRKADVGLRESVITIDKAVVLLGFTTVRNAVLSIKVFEAFSAPRQRTAGPAGHGARNRFNGDSDETDADLFDRAGFWRHCLAVAVAAEAIAATAGNSKELSPGDAFVAGLLHDIGKLALDHVLPRSFARVLELVGLNQGNIAEFERRIVGIDHHTAGKRLAEQWNLPHMLQDCIWLHGSAYDMLPRLDHKRMIGVISLADLIARQKHLGYSGNFTFKQTAEQLAQDIGLDPARVAAATENLHVELEKRCRALGIDERPSQELFMQSIQQANQMLGTLNSALDRKSRATARQTQVLSTITSFHGGAVPGRSVEDVLGAVAASAATILGQGFYAMLFQSSPGESWLVAQYNSEGRCVHSQIVDPPVLSPDLASLDPSEPTGLNLLGILPWVTDYLLDSPDLREIRVMPLGCGWGTAALMLHDRPAMPPWREMQALTMCWGTAVASAAQHDGARRIGEELAEANRALAEAQDRLLQHESMARLGEMAAGAAHEMNNPLAVISGRAQLLAKNLAPGCKEQQAAQVIFEQAHRLSDLISSMRSFADPPKAVSRPTDLAKVLDDVVKRVQASHPDSKSQRPAELRIMGSLPPVMLDPQHIGQAFAELLLNAMQSQPKSGVYVTARADQDGGWIVIDVTDDGVGMDAYTLSHALDPFFSSKSAGRRVGMGLPRAQQLVSALGGKIDLRSTAGQGTTASLLIPLDSPV